MMYYALTGKKIKRRKKVADLTEENQALKKKKTDSDSDSLSTKFYNKEGVSKAVSIQA